MAKIYTAKVKATGKPVEVYKSSTDQNKYISYEDCNTAFDSNELENIQEKEITLG